MLHILLRIHILISYLHLLFGKFTPYIFATCFPYYLIFLLGLTFSGNRKALRRSWVGGIIIHAIVCLRQSLTQNSLHRVHLSFPLDAKVQNTSYNKLGQITFLKDLLFHTVEEWCGVSWITRETLEIWIKYILKDFINPLFAVIERG